MCRYLKAYQHAMLPSKEEWMKVDLPCVVGPPHARRPRGRPKTVRIRGEDEKGKRKKSEQQHRCSRCGAWVHHSTTCKNPINGEPPTQSHCIKEREEGKKNNGGRKRAETSPHWRGGPSVQHDTIMADWLSQNQEQS